MTTSTSAGALCPLSAAAPFRLETPTQGMFRYLATDVDLGGTVLPADSHVYLSFAAANRDPSIFPDPEALRPDREEAIRHVAFGQGPHTCLGAWLARLEITHGVAALLDRVAAIELAPCAATPYGPSFLLHGLQRLDVVVTPAS